MLHRRFGSAAAESDRYRAIFAARFPPATDRLVARWQQGRLPPAPMAAGGGHE
jgi:hypothetical protein